MKPVIKERGDFRIVGIEVRTQNREEMEGEGKIGFLWERFYAEDILGKIPHQIDSGTVLSLYTDYESDVDGEYSVVVGAEVTKVGELSDGLVAKSVPRSKYAVFTSVKGAIPNIVIETWKHIYSLKEGQIGCDRAYRGDFEIYDGRVKDPNNAQIDIYLSIH